MKIGLLLPSVYMGERHKDRIFAPKELLLNLADKLVERGHTVFVYGAPETKTKARLVAGDELLIKKDFYDPKFASLKKIAQISLMHFQSKREYELDLTMKAYTHAQDHGLDIIHSYHDFFAHYVGRITNIPTVYTLHDPRPKPNSFEYWRYKHFKNDNYIFISKSQEKNYGNLVKKFAVIYHGVDIKRFPFEEYPKDYVAFIGRYMKQKGVTDAIRASSNSDVLLKIAGDNASRTYSYYNNKVKPLLKKGKAEELDFFGIDERNKFLMMAKALLFPIQWEEPFGMVMVESMATGTPVIAFKRGSVPEVIEDGKTGYIVPKQEGLEGFTHALKKLLSLSEEEYRQMRLASRVLVEKRFTTDVMARNHEEAYKRAIVSNK